ncbi:hypothetical protein PoMZ_05593, partial [Pyricularia oryzae]
LIFHIVWVVLDVPFGRVSEVFGRFLSCGAVARPYSWPHRHLETLLRHIFRVAYITWQSASVPCSSRADKPGSLLMTTSPYRRCVRVEGSCLVHTNSVTLGVHDSLQLK